MRRKRSGRLEYTFWGRRQPGDMTLEESAENLSGLLDFPDSGTEHRTAVPFSQNTYCKTSAPLPDTFWRKELLR